MTGIQYKNIQDKEIHKIRIHRIKTNTKTTGQHAKNSTTEPQTLFQVRNMTVVVHSFDVFSPLILPFN